MTAFKGLGTYGNGVGVVTPLDHKLAQAGLLVKTSTPLGVRSGVFFQGNASLVTGTAGMAYSVAAYACATQRSPGAGVVLGGNDGSVSVATTAAPGSNSRIDIIYHFHREFALGDADSTPVIGVVQGTAAASPVAPSLAAFPGAIELARVTVAAGATSTNGAGVTIAQTAPFTSADGSPVPFRTKTELDAWITANQGQKARVLANGIDHEYFALYNASTNPTGATPAGWYPTSGSVYGSATRSAAGFNIPVVLGGSTQNVVGTSVSLTIEAAVGLTFSNGWVVPATGIYEVAAFWRGGGAIDAYIGFGVGSGPEAAWLIDNYYGAKITVLKKFTAGDTVKMFAGASALTGWDANPANGAFGIKWVGVAR